MSKTQTSTGLRVRMKIGGWRKGLSRYGGGSGLWARSGGDASQVISLGG